ncbi:hypothetical protein PLICRDRAFT_169363 [Plicaturopsis crispa FD-325 SS-3]|nr:hypothetical protein PLICRDRAFT_169363 [Plicaturopsis crispa FD-325 SS-3]
MLPIIASLALLALVAAQPPSLRPSTNAPQVKRDLRTPFLGAQWNVPSPQANDSKTYEIHTTSANSTWEAIEKDLAGWELTTTGDKAGVRLLGDDSSAAIYRYNGSVPPIMQVQYNVADEYYEMDVDNEAWVWSDYTLGSNASRSDLKKRDSWDDLTDFKTVPLDTIGFTITNVDCDYGLSITATVVDANGTTTSYNGTDNVSFNVQRPANITVTNKEHPLSNATIFVSDSQPLSVALGSGNAPTPGFGFTASVQYCPD